MNYHKLKLYAFIGLLGASMLSCARRVNYVESDQALLPVMVKGNKTSHQYLIVIAGGPAGDGIIYHYVFPFFKKLEKEYKVVYYDQRGSGNAKGEPPINSLNLDQHSIDLYKIISSIKSKDDQASIYIVGYSYGGSIALQYLKNRQSESQVEGTIMIAGAFDRKLRSQYQQQLTIEFLEQWVDEGYIESYDYLTSEFSCPPNLKSCKQDSVETMKKVNKRFKKIDKASKFPINLVSIKNLLHYALFAPGSPFRSAKNEAKNAGYFQPEFDSLMLINNLEITSPMLLIAGRLDTNVPYYDAQHLYDELKLPNESKKLLILEHSGHLPMFTEPKLMIEAIRKFIH